MWDAWRDDTQGISLIRKWSVSKVLGALFLPLSESGVCYGEVDETRTLLNRIGSISFGWHLASVCPKSQYAISFVGEIPAMCQGKLQELER